MIKLYQYQTCPYCAKVRSKLEELGVKYQAIDVDYFDKPEIVMKANNGVVPVLQDGNQVITESDEIVDYLQNKYSKSL